MEDRYGEQSPIPWSRGFDLSLHERSKIWMQVADSHVSDPRREQQRRQHVTRVARASQLRLVLGHEQITVIDNKNERVIGEEVVEDLAGAIEKLVLVILGMPNDARVDGEVTTQ